MLKTYRYNGMKLLYEEGKQPAGAVEVRKVAPPEKVAEMPEEKAKAPANKAQKPSNKSRKAVNK